MNCIKWWWNRLLIQGILKDCQYLSVYKDQAGNVDKVGRFGVLWEEIRDKDVKVFHEDEEEFGIASHPS